VPKVPRKTPEPSSVTDETRERMIQGAGEAFGRLGYAEARVEDILAAAGVSRPTFYKVFDGKEELLQILSERHHREIRERIALALEGVRDPLAQVEAVVDAFMRWRAELGPLGRVLDQEARTPGTRIARHRKTTIDAVSALGGRLFEAAGGGKLDPVVFQGLVPALEGVADALLQKRPVRAATIERARRAGLQIVMGTLGSELTRVLT
jgi:AcrR family transcriptional regulator